DGEEPAKPGLRVVALFLDALDHLVDHRPLPGVQHLLEQSASITELPVEATLGDADLPGEGFDADGVRATRGERVQTLVDPAIPWCQGRCRHPIYTLPYTSDEASEHGTHLPALADPRDRPRLPGGGRLGAADAGRSG